ncbi:Heat shock protein HslJ [Pedobacter steynii]|uniref:Heat shock protein HslJ n=1 Tax=Pedobacter steynii TaxID=430522 RepID=A0A1G9UMK1_9SPHI|nr:META domain-containing protein [Pedobacter steynii]NQX40805.1 META domain-containing protein [Pedobacter steynii]SDM60755.1 Heat shock protein HslJ [Pedobacter steynii]
MRSTQYITLGLCVLSLSACSIFKKTAKEQTAEDAKQSNVITDRRWKLVELAGKPVADKVNGKEPFLLLQKSDSRYSASGGCNGIGGEFTLENNGRIKFAQGMSTMMACENMEVEQELSKALITADNYSLSGDNLSLNKARMAPLARFKAVK